MTILLVLLLVAEIPTAFFNWTSLELVYSSTYDSASYAEVSAANATSYARCFFNMHVANERFQIAARCRTFCNFTEEGCYTTCTDDGWQSLSETTAFQNVIITFLLLVFTFFTRVMKIMDSLSTWATYSLRIPLSRWWRRKMLLADSIFLRSPTLWTPRRILRWKHFVVKQELAVLLLARLYADLYTSTLSEVRILLVFL